MRETPAAPSAGSAQAEITHQARALRTAIGHIEHMAAWISAQKAGYSFEGLGEDLPGIRAALEEAPALRCTICGFVIDRRFEAEFPPENSPNCKQEAD